MLLFLSVNKYLCVVSLVIINKLDDMIQLIVTIMPKNKYSVAFFKEEIHCISLAKICQIYVGTSSIIWGLGLYMAV